MVVTIEFHCRRGAGDHAAGHTEVAEDDIVIVEMNQDVFGPPIDTKDSPTLQASGKACRQGKAQIGAPLDDTAQAAPLELHGKTATDGFDFGQFGHQANLLDEGAAQRSAPFMQTLCCHPWPKQHHP
jgi:hypothetical protein